MELQSHGLQLKIKTNQKNIGYTALSILDTCESLIKSISLVEKEIICHSKLFNSNTYSIPFLVDTYDINMQNLD
jgi:hypothetical protein